jgi:rhodanese-related sulfurtransferase
MLILLMIAIKKLLLIAIVTIIAVSCARFFNKGTGKTEALPSFATVGVEEFQTYIADDNVQLVDVRTNEEFEDGHIVGSVLIDVNEADFMEKAMATLDKQRPVAVYCRSGRRSARAASMLVSQGFMVTNLDGGVLAWQDLGKALVK